MPDYPALQDRIDELLARAWDVADIEARVNKFTSEGIPRKKLNPMELTANRGQALDRVQRRAEEYNYYLKNCPQSTALALMEEFGLGNMEIIKALTPFPGIGGSGETCGGVSGGLIGLGLYFGPDTPPDFEQTGAVMMAAQRFLAEFEETVGHLACADIIETVIIGRRVNPGEGDEAMGTYTEEHGFEKCCLLPGIGARIAAGIIIDSME